MLTYLSRFVEKSAQHARPLFKLLRKEVAFEWTAECEQALTHLKQALLQTSILSRPEKDEILYLYLADTPEEISATLIIKTLEGKRPIYFTSKALQGLEVRYHKIGRVALTLINAARRLGHYLLVYTIVIRKNQLIKQLLGMHDTAAKMLKWSLEL